MSEYDYSGLYNNGGPQNNNGRQRALSRNSPRQSSPVTPMWAAAE